MSFFSMNETKKRESSHFQVPIVPTTFSRIIVVKAMLFRTVVKLSAIFGFFALLQSTHCLVLQKPNAIEVDESFQIKDVKVYSTLQEVQSRLSSFPFQPRSYYIDTSDFSRHIVSHSARTWAGMRGLILHFQVDYPSAVYVKSVVHLFGEDAACAVRLVIDGEADSVAAEWSVTGFSNEDENIALQKVVRMEPGFHNFTVEIGGPTTHGTCCYFLGPYVHTRHSLSALVVPLTAGVVYGNAEGSADTIFNTAAGVGSFIPFPGTSATLDLAEESAVLVEAAVSVRCASPRFAVLSVTRQGDGATAYGVHTKPSAPEHNTLHFSKAETLSAGSHSYSATYLIPSANASDFEGHSDCYSNAASAPSSYFQRLSYIAIPTRFGARAGMTYGTTNLDQAYNNTFHDVPGLSLTVQNRGMFVPYTALVMLNFVATPTTAGSYAIYRTVTDSEAAPGVHFQSGTTDEADCVHNQYVVVLPPRSDHSIVGQWAIYGNMISPLVTSPEIYAQQLCYFSVPML